MELQSRAVLLLAACVALGSTSVVAPQTAATTGPAERWRVEVNPGRATLGPVGVAIERNRVVVAGSGGGNAVTTVLSRRTGDPIWTDRYESGAAGIVVALATDRRTFYVVGNVDATANCASYGSFVRAVPVRGGPPRWLAESCTDLDSPPEWLRAATLADRRLFVVGRAGNKILVRAYRASTGRLLWEDNAELGSPIGESATHVIAADGRLYVIGTRDTVLGRTAVYVARAYEAETGKRLWESTFGGLVNFVEGVGLVEGTLVVAGYVWDMGPGITRAEIRGLDPASGAVSWMRRPFRSFDAYSSPEALVTAGSVAIVGGLVSRRRSLPMLGAWAANGDPLWSGEATGDGYGHIRALAVAGDVLIATGGGSRRAGAPRQDLLLQVHDLVSGRLDWTTRLRFRGGDAVGLAIATAGGDFVVAGTSESRAGGNRRWTVISYRR